MHGQLIFTARIKNILFNVFFSSNIVESVTWGILNITRKRQAVKVDLISNFETVILFEKSLE